MKSRKNLAILIVSLVVLTMIITGCSFVEPVESEKYTASGQVVDGTGSPIEGVTITCGGQTTDTDSEGNWSIANLEGNVTAAAAKDGWTFAPSTINVDKDNSTNINFEGAPVYVAPDIKILDARATEIYPYSPVALYKYDYAVTVSNNGGEGEFKIDVLGLPAYPPNPELVGPLFTTDPQSIEAGNFKLITFHLNTRYIQYEEFKLILYVLNNTDWVAIDKLTIIPQSN